MFKAVTISSFLKIINLPISLKKQLVLLLLSIIGTAVSIISSNDVGYESSSFTVFAQIDKDSNQKMLSHSQYIANSNSSINAKSTTTFCPLVQ